MNYVLPVPYVTRFFREGIVQMIDSFTAASLLGRCALCTTLFELINRIINRRVKLPFAPGITPVQSNLLNTCNVSLLTDTTGILARELIKVYIFKLHRRRVLQKFQLTTPDLFSDGRVFFNRTRPCK